MPEIKKGIKTKSLEDRAWLDMSSRLDVSLPVHKGMSSREKLLLLLLLLLIISMGSYVAYNEANRVKERPMDILLDGDFATIPQSGKKEIELASVENAGRNTQIEDEEALFSNSGNALASYNDIKIDKPLLNGNNQVDAIRNQEDIRETIHNLELRSSVEHAALSGNSDSRFINLRKLSNRWNTLTHESEEPISLSNSGIFHMPRMKSTLCRNSYALHGGIISENLISFGGLEAGIQYYYSLNRKMALQSGLNFQTFFKNGFANSLALSSFDNTPGRPPNAISQADSWVEKRYKYDVENSEIINNEVGAEYITGVVDKLYYLSVPVNLMYSFKSTRIYAGLNASLLLRGTNMIRDYDDQYFNTVILSSSVIEKRNYLNRIDFGVQLGFEKPIYKNLLFYANYHHGLFKIINAESAEVSNSSFRDVYETIYQKSFDQRVDFNRYFTVGVKYLIKPCDW